MPLESAPELPDERLWTVPEIAEYLGESQSTVRRRLDAHDLTYIDTALAGERRRPRVPDSEVKRWKARRTITRKSA